jgi:hypothetical protein
MRVFFPLVLVGYEVLFPLHATLAHKRHFSFFGGEGEAAKALFPLYGVAQVAQRPAPGNLRRQ